MGREGQTVVSALTESTVTGDKKVREMLTRQPALNSLEGSLPFF